MADDAGLLGDGGESGRQAQGCGLCLSGDEARRTHNLNLATWVFRDESCHMEFAFEAVRTVREEEPDLFDDEMKQQVYAMLEDAIECAMQFASDVLSGGVAGISERDMRQYLPHCADHHFAKLGMHKRYHVRNPLPFMELQDVQELIHFFERRVSAYQIGVTGDVGFDHAF